MVGINFFENLILVQDERWRRALSMQIERVARLVVDGSVTRGNIPFCIGYPGESRANTV